jgi:hypothetical protein
MIKLLYFLPCEKVLMPGEEPGPASLIGVMEEVSIEMSGEEEMPENAAVPLNWMVATLWERSEDLAEPIAYECKFDMYSPTGKPLLGGAWDLLVTSEKVRYRTTTSFQAFPIGRAGRYLLKLQSRKKGEQEWENVSEYPVRVVYKTPTAQESPSKPEKAAAKK